MNIVNMLAPETKWDIKCPYPMKPEYITVHNTYNDAPAKNEVKYMITNDNLVSFHYAVDDIEVVQGIREDRNAWHASDGANGNGNRKSIAIEICYSKSGGERFDKAEKNAVILIAELMNKYNIDIDHIKRHYDFATDKKYCPHRTMDNGWERFKNMIRVELGKPTEEIKQETPKPVTKPQPDRRLDQIFEVGSYAELKGVWPVDQVLADRDSIWCKALTGNGGNSIQAAPLIKCTADGVRTSNQVFKVGDHFYCDEKFLVLGIDAATDAIQINVGGRLIWVYAKPFDEVLK